MKFLSRFLVFLLLFLVSLYLTFPFERIASGVLQEKGISVKGLKFYHFPPRFSAEEVCINGIRLKKVVVKPSFNFSSFKISGNLCSGKLILNLSRDFKDINFSIEKLKLEDCPFNYGIKVKGILNGNGNLIIENGFLTKGKGTFNLDGLNLENLNLGFVSYKFFDLGKGNISYRVAGKNYVKVTGRLSGKDADTDIKGELSVNLRNLNRTYLNLTVTVKLKTGNFKGRIFTFKIQGNPNSLRFF